MCKSCQIGVSKGQKLGRLDEDGLDREMLPWGRGSTAKRGKCVTSQVAQKKTSNKFGTCKS